MLDTLHHLYFAPFTFETEMTAEARLPLYKGSVWRGGFGHVFRRAMQRVGDEAAYQRLFEPTVDDRDTALALDLNVGGDAPRPFVLVPPLETERRMEPGTMLAFTLVLVGEAVDALPFFIHTFDILGERFGIGTGRKQGMGRFRLCAVRDATGQVLYRDGHLTGQEGHRFHAADIAAPDPDTERLHLRFLTPTRVKTKFRRKKRSLMKPRTGEDFLALVDSLYRRLFRLTWLYCRGEDMPVKPYTPLVLDGPGPVLLNPAIRWDDWSRYSTRQEDKMKLGGFVGEATFCGEVGRYVPLFRLGSHLHIGHGTTFGLGKVEVATG